jgi:hypothetical protein
MTESPDYEAVLAAINSAAPGDIVTVAEGTATWTHPLVITKGIILKGAGKNKTIIKGNISPAGTYMVVYQPSNPSANEPFRISGFTFDGQGVNSALLLKNWTTIPINKIRIDHNYFTGGTSRNLYVLGTIYGVIDNNEFYHVPSTPSILFGPNGHDNAWSYLTFDFGTADNIYWEDNVITSNDCLIQCDYNGRYAFRHNTIYFVYQSNGFYPLFDAHGNQPNLHSTMGIEIYENTIVSTYKGGCLVDQRGGKALVYNNIVSAPESVSTKVREEYYDSVTPPANNPISGQPQHVSDSYYWNNKMNGVRFDPYAESSLDYGEPEGIVPREDKHFWYQKDGFNGTSGMGVGPVSNRPVTCTPGVAYWATDEKKLYRCTAPNVWTLYYTPYTYPHPLRTLLGD